jgi:hypothetical protein
VLQPLEFEGLDNFSPDLNAAADIIFFISLPWHFGQLMDDD